MMLIQFRLRIEQVHLTGTAIHEQLDHGLRTRLKMRLAGLKVIDRTRRARRR